MNIAFPALLLFLLLIPGFLYRAAFKSLEGEKVDAGPFASTTLKSILSAFVLNILAWAFVELVTPYTVHWDALLGLMVGEKADGGTKTSGANAAIALVAAHPVPHVAYFALLYTVSLLAGWGTRAIVEKYSLDRADRRFHRLWRSGTEWYYLFNGRDEPFKPYIVYVTTLVNLDEPYLYRGIFERYFLTGNGELDRIVLSGVSRRKMSADRKEGEGKDEENPAFYTIYGDFFVLRYSEIATLNIAYWAYRFDDMPVDDANAGDLAGIVG